MKDINYFKDQTHAEAKDQPKTYKVVYRTKKQSPNDTPRYWEVIEEVQPGGNIDTLINRYMSIQNAGEMKSDRIVFVSKKKIS